VVLADGNNTEGNQIRESRGQVKNFAPRQG